MRAMLLRSQAPIGTSPLELADIAMPTPEPGAMCVRVRACATCRTDLHVIEGDLAPRRMPIVPGHQVVGRDTRSGRPAVQARRPRRHRLAPLDVRGL
jgi:propanol-preferring alcohol dehydrogenase